MAIAAPRRRRPWIGFVLCLAGIIAVIAGGVMLRGAGQGDVETIRVTKHSMIPETLLGEQPDYYLIVTPRDDSQKGDVPQDGAPTESGPEQTNAYDDTPIGNGLDFKLKKPLAVEAIAHIELMDKDLGSDDMCDRVDVSQRFSKGQDYQFELVGPPDPRHSRGTTSLAVGAAVFIIGLILVVRSYAI
jgi:hypothetical protein